MPEEEKKKPNFFQKVAAWGKKTLQWAAETFSDPALTTLMLDDLGLDSTSGARPAPPDPAAVAKIDEFVAAENVQLDALVATAVQFKALADTFKTFADAVGNDSVRPADVFWLIFKVWMADSLRARNPAAFGLVSIVNLITEDEEVVDQLDLGPLFRLFTGDSELDSSEVIDRLSFIVGTTVVALDNIVTGIGGAIDASYGWDPEPGSPAESVAVAARALTVTVVIPDSPVHPVITVIGVPAEHHGPGIILSVGARLSLSHVRGTTRYTVDAGANGPFAMYLGAESQGDPHVEVFGSVEPSFTFRSEPVPSAAGAPALVVGTTDGLRLEIGSFAFGVEIGGNYAAVRAALRNGKLVISLGQGDGFLKNLPGGTIDVPFDLGLILDTKEGLRFEGGTGLKVNLPVAASLFGAFTVQYIQLELVLGERITVEFRGGFSVKLGPFQASVDQLGLGMDFTALRQDAALDKMVTFLPPKGIGLRLDAGPVKGGGYLFVDAQRGEYAGALELTFVGLFSLKAICLITTKRPDGSEGWSLLIMIYAQEFSLHIAFGIFLTGVGGMIGLHHRVDLDALQAGLKTGALDDILFPENPVADAPRIITRYKQLFPIEQDSLILGPMLELSFGKPAIVFIRLGLIFEVSNALGGDKPVALTKVILLGQLIAQMPPKALGVPPMLKLLIDIVGFYDAEEKFLLIRARLRDSFIGIAGGPKLDLSGELLLAMRFGDDPSFVLSAGGFHPVFKDFPKGVPTSLERLAVAFAIGPVKLRCETYFALTSNSIQAGLKVILKADFGVASIEGWFGLDALIYTTPKFRFIGLLDFSVSLRAGGTSLCSVGVKMSLEGPGEWRAVGKFSFSILFWDVNVPFDERWGSAPAIQERSESAAAALLSELGDSSRIVPDAPPGGAMLVTLDAGGEKGARLAHPLGRLSIRQRAVPFDVTIDRMGALRLTEGSVQFSVTSVTVGGVLATAVEPVIDHFSRGQFMEMSEQDKLGGKSFERFPCGASVGTESYRIPGPGATATASYEEKILEPGATVDRFPWALVRLQAVSRALPDDLLDMHVAFGAAARSTRGAARGLAGGPGTATLRHDPRISLVDPTTLEPVASLLPRVESSDAVARQQSMAMGVVVVEAFELAGA